MLARGMISQGGIPARQAGAGDILASGEVLTAMTADANSTITGAGIAGGVIRRSGQSAGRTDTTDTTENVLNAVGGNDFDTNVLPGSVFHLIYQNTVAQVITWAHGRGWRAGLGVLDVAASQVREFLCRVLNSTPEFNCNISTTNASAAVTLDVPQAPGSITPGMTVTAANVTAGTRVAGVTYGKSTTRDNTDKICAITLDANATGTAAGTAAIFSPTIEIDGLRGTSL